MENREINVTTDENERQLEQHGIAPFPIAFYQGDLRSNTVVWHWHEELELILIQKGNIGVGAGKTREKLNTGQGCFINGGVLHNIWKIETTPCEYRSIVFHPRFIGSMDSLFWINYIHPLKAPSFPQYIPFLNKEGNHLTILFSQLWKIQEEKAIGYENEVRYLLTKFFIYLSNIPLEQQQRLSIKEQRDMDRMKLMLTFVETHLSEELSLGQIAKSALISETECLRCFRRSIGASPIHFLKERRLQCAAGLLLSTNKSISSIAPSCGFLDTSYFTRAFGQLFGMTPTEYRNVHKRH